MSLLEQKLCTWCKEFVDKTEFHKNKAQADGLHGHCKPCVKERSVSRKKNNPRVTRANELRKYYDMSIDDYDKLFAEQDGRCAICKRHQDHLISDRRKVLCVDHDHTTGEVRGLLCGSCNSALGLFKDKIENLQAALDYLQKKGVRRPQQGAAK